MINDGIISDTHSKRALELRTNQLRATALVPGTFWATCNEEEMTNMK